MGATILNDPPTLSVLMGTLYLRTDCSMLRRSVESIISQSFQDFEFLICDDGSSQEAQDYLNLAAAADSRIRLIRPGDKFSLAPKLNACLVAARGLFIGRMDDDDYARPDRFEKQISALMSDSKLSFVGSNVDLWQNEQTVGTRFLPECPTIRDYYITQPYVHPALIFKREALFKVGGYSEKRSQELCEDYDLLLRLHKNGYLGKNLQESLLTYTIPLNAKGSRRMRHRFHEMVTRFCRYRELGILPGALPYVVKPVLTGLLPEKLLIQIKRRYYES